MEESLSAWCSPCLIRTNGDQRKRRSFVELIAEKPRESILYINVITACSSGDTARLYELLKPVNNIALLLHPEIPFEADLERWLELDIVELGYATTRYTDDRRIYDDCFAWQYLARSTTITTLYCDHHHFMHTDMTVGHAAFAQNRSVVTVYMCDYGDPCTSAGVLAFADAVVARPWPIYLAGTLPLFKSDTDAAAPGIAHMLRNNKLAAASMYRLPWSAEVADAFRHTTSMAYLFTHYAQTDMPALAALDHCLGAKPETDVIFCEARYDAAPCWRFVQAAPVSNVQKAVFSTILWGDNSDQYISENHPVRMDRMLRALDSLFDDLGPEFPFLVDQYLSLAKPHPLDHQTLEEWVRHTMARVWQKNAGPAWPAPFGNEYTELVGIMDDEETYNSMQHRHLEPYPDDKPCSVRCVDGTVETTTGVVRFLRGARDIDATTPIEAPDFVRVSDILVKQPDQLVDKAEFIRRVRAAEFLHLPTLSILADCLWFFALDTGLFAVTRSSPKRHKA